MCGRKTLTKGKIEIIQELLVDDWNDDWTPSYNIAPSQITPILIYNQRKVIKNMRWGLIPSWAKDIKIGNRLINARSETITEKPSFRNLVKRNRCIVIADGYFEWKKSVNSKIPYYLSHPEKQILPMAGLWDKWIDGAQNEVYSYTVITTNATELISHIHNRMPVILKPDNIKDWINTDTKEEKALSLLASFNSRLNYYPVSQFVNSPHNNNEICIKPIDLHD